MRKLSTDLQAGEEERKKIGEFNKKLKGDVSVLIKEKEKLMKSVSSRDKEKEGLVTAHATKVEELQLQIEALQNTVKKFKKALPERYKMGFSKGVHDYMKSTWKVLPDLDWALLGADAVTQVEAFKAEAAAEVSKSPNSSSKKVLRSSSTPDKSHVQAATSDVKDGVPADAVEDTPGNDAENAGSVDKSPSPEAVKDV